MLGNDSIIYGIKDPGTKEVRYIGRTQNFKTRQVQHFTPTSLNTGRPLALWIKGLLEKGIKPDFFIIDTDIAPEIADLAEQSWIDYYKGKGCILLNTGLPKTASWRKIIRAA